MEVEDGSFFDSEFSSMMHPDFTLEDLDELLHSIDSNLQSSIDSQQFPPVQSRGFNGNCDALSSPSTETSSSPAQLSIKSECPSIISYSSSSSEDSFDPDNFLNMSDSDVRMDRDSESHATVSKHHDCESRQSMSDAQQSDDSLMQNKASSPSNNLEVVNSNVECIPPRREPLCAPTEPVAINSLPAHNSSTSISTATLSLKQPTFNLLQGTLIPVKTVPLKTLNLGSTSNATVFRSELAPNITSKISPPSPQPKTIILSPEDFKILKEKLEKSKTNTILEEAKKVNISFPKLNIKSPNSQFLMKSSEKFKPLIVKETELLQAVSPENRINSPAVKIFKSQIDEKTLKKQQRMIRNRESASASRKKKREYVLSLEARINDLEKETDSLKEDNSKLRSQIISMIKKCRCNNSNLSSLTSAKLKIETNQNLKTMSPAIATYSAIRPRCSIKARILNTNMKKNTAVLLAMVFMVSFNIGNFHTLISRELFSQPSTSLNDYTNEDIFPKGMAWISNENDELNWNRIDAENMKTFEHLPLAVQHPPHSLSRRRKRSVVIPPIYPKCPINTNQTENLRLASKLRKWINVNDYLNSSSVNVNKRSTKIQLDNDYFNVKELRYSINRGQIITSKKTNPIVKNEKNNLFEENSKNSVQLHNEYFWLFKENNRQEDTNYVVTLSSDNFLTLPASVYNKTTRPKMSLLLPGKDPTMKNSVTLMQIDCEVMNITEVQLNYDMIPLKLRPIRSFKSHSNPNMSDEGQNVTTGSRQKYNSNTNRTFERKLFYPLKKFLSREAKQFGPSLVEPEAFQKQFPNNLRPINNLSSVAKQQNTIINYLP